MAACYRDSANLSRAGVVRKNVKTESLSADRDTTLAKPLAPEDIRPGDYVAILDRQYEYPAIAWRCDFSLGSEDEVIRVRVRPTDTEPPLRVVDACLPFVYVTPPKGNGRTLDLRCVRLARLDRDYARRVGKELAGKKRKRRK